MKAAFFLVVPNNSKFDAIMFSNTASTVENAAKLINKKNSEPHNLPPAIALNTFGKVIKINAGPESAGIPNAEVDGKIINPHQSNGDPCQYNFRK